MADDGDESDDEETLEEAEKDEERAEITQEVEALIAEQDLPMDELLSRYPGYAQREPRSAEDGCQSAQPGAPKAPSEAEQGGPSDAGASSASTQPAAMDIDPTPSPSAAAAAAGTAGGRRSAGRDVT